MAMMVVVWFFARRMDNAGIVDIWWAFGFTPVAVFYGVFGSGHMVRNGLIAAMVCAWSLRLGMHLYQRVMSHRDMEDPRYADLRRQFPRRTWLMFFGFFQLHGLLIGLLGIPVALACANPAPGVGLFEAAGVLLWLVGIGGEAIADKQLQLFKAHPASKGRVCDFGLWKYSRHPNYFFQWLSWVGFAVMAMDFSGAAPQGWFAWLAPAFIYWLLTRVSGVPPLEKHMLASRGAAYRDYQSRVNMFFPGPQRLA